jgi:hypothetical protein
VAPELCSRSARARLRKSGQPRHDKLTAQPVPSAARALPHFSSPRANRATWHSPQRLCPASTHVLDPCRISVRTTAPGQAPAATTSSMTLAHSTSPRCSATHHSASPTTFLDWACNGISPNVLCVHKYLSRPAQSVAQSTPPLAHARHTKFPSPNVHSSHRKLEFFHR